MTKGVLMFALNGQAKNSLAESVEVDYVKMAVGWKPAKAEFVSPLMSCCTLKRQLLAAVAAVVS